MLRPPAGKGSLDNINLFSIITIVSFFLLAPVALLTEVGGLGWGGAVMFERVVRWYCATPRAGH